jgi:hypothetical protein
MLRLIFKALGSKEGDTDKEADKVAWIRLGLVGVAVVTNILISANILVGWLK